MRIGSCTTRLPILTRANVPILIQWEYQFRTKLSLELLAEATRFRRRNTFVSNRKPRPNRNSLFALIKSHSCCARIDSLQPAPSNAPQHLRPGMIWPKNPFLGAHRTGENRRGPAPFCEPTKKRPGQDPHLVKATTAHCCPQLTLEKPLRLPTANDLASQKMLVPPLPVIVLVFGASSTTAILRTNYALCRSSSRQRSPSGAGSRFARIVRRIKLTGPARAERIKLTGRTAERLR